MLHAETTKNEKGVLMKIEGEPIQTIFELYALAVAISEEFNNEEMTESFIDDLPYMVRAYRETLKSQTKIDNTAIEKAKGER